MKKTVRIGTRKSELALMQAHTVGKSLSNESTDYEIVEIDSKGDLDLTTPLYQLGITGVFTKSLDIALLEERIDIAVHSLKDVPTLLPAGIIQSAVLKRDNSADMLAVKSGLDINFEASLTIATGSIRRKAQWLHRYPNHTICGLRGNVNTRLKKLEDNDWHGAIFSSAGLERINLVPDNSIALDWMVPAPAQGVIAITVLEKNRKLHQLVRYFNHSETELTSTIERNFLNELEGGCSAPIGAFAKVENGLVKFHGILTSVDGTLQVDVKKETPIDKAKNFGRIAAQELLSNGGQEIMCQLK